MSGKLLYGEAQAQKQYMTMMQASTSHECKQPLTSITYQLQSLQKILKHSFKQEKELKRQLDEMKFLLPDKTEACNGLLTSYHRNMLNLKYSCCELLSSTQKIEFFVEGMLDLCLLTERKENFKRNIEQFDIYQAISCVRNLFKTRVVNKQLNFVTSFMCFERKRSTFGHTLDEINFEASDHS